jgi:3-phosphoglycerate kinase
MAKRGVQDAALRGRRVLLRVDFNVPQDASGQIADDWRIQEALPTLNHLRAGGARTILLTHLGRPHGQRDPKFSLKPIARRLSSLLGQPVPLADDIVGIHALEMSARVENGQFLMLENLRFHPGEEANDPAFAGQLARLGELFVQDAFAVLHRAHASTVGVPKRLPSVAGLLVEREVRELTPLVTNPAHPYAVIIGGAKVADKLPLLTSFCGRADSILIGGALAFPFLAAAGHSVGTSPMDAALLPAVARFTEQAAAAGTKLELPTDLIIDRPGGAPPSAVTVDAVPADAAAHDIGPATRARFRDALQGTRTVFWNGPLGQTEDARFAAGTREVLGALASIPGHHVGGGGDSQRAAQELGVLGGFQFISTGGGASLEFVQGLELPGLAVLPDA